MRNRARIYVISLTFSLFIISCSHRKQLEAARVTSVEIELPTKMVNIETAIAGEALTTYQDKEGVEHTIGRNTLDETTGEQLLTVGLSEVKVTARAKNVPERNGLVRIDFTVRVPQELLNDNWELYLAPLNKGKALEGITFTGVNFQAKQARQYDYYNELRKVIIPESNMDEFIHRAALEKALAKHNRAALRSAKLAYRKNLKAEEYKLLTHEDTMRFISHYVDQKKVNRNEYFKKVLDARFNQLVTLRKRPDLKCNILANPDSSINYTYTVELPASDIDARVSLSMQGEIRTLNADIYPVKVSDSLTFIVSTMRSFIRSVPAAPDDYQEGLSFLKDGKYKDALELLRSYADYNTAVCYLSLGFDRMAHKILSELPVSADKLYLQAIACVRLGNDTEAVRFYTKSCEMDKSKVWRGNLDPEINRLKKSHNLNNDEF